MSDLKVYNDLNIKQDAYASGSLKISTAESFNASIVTSSEGMYNIDTALHTIDQTIVQVKQAIKNVYEGARYKYTGSFDGSGNASLNLTTLAPSGTMYFTTASLDTVDVQVLVDTNGDLTYRNDLVSINLYASGENLLLDLAAPSAANRQFRILAINQTNTNSSSSPTPPQIILILNDWFEEAILTGSYASTGDSFGRAIDINSAGDRIVVGAWKDEISSPTDTGLAYIYVSSSTGWKEEKVLTGSYATQTGDDYGMKVAINSAGDRIVIASDYDEIGSPSNRGLVYIYSSSSVGWREEKILTGSLVGSLDYFGASVAINSAGNIIVVGAFADESGAIFNTGLAYVFSSSSAGWIEEKILSGSYAVDTDDQFGLSVAINSIGNKIVVGASGDEISPSVDTGLAYVFSSSSAGWIEEKVLSGSYAIDGNERFGWSSIAINSNGDRIIVGAYADSGSNGGTSSGLAYVFSSSSAGWIEEKVLSGSYAVDYVDNFGTSVDINSVGDIVIISATGDEIGANSNTGVVYIFTSSSAGGWIEKKILTGSLAVDGNELFGYVATAINSYGDKIAVGAPTDRKTIYTSGLAYVFTGSLT